MTGNSIKKTLPGMARFMILILIILILPTNVALQLYIQHQNQKQNSEEIFWQLEQLIRNNIYDLEREKRDFSQKCIQSAKMAAYFVEHNPGYITDLEHTKELAEKLDVDEIHFIDPQGEIYAVPIPGIMVLHSGMENRCSFFFPCWKILLWSCVGRSLPILQKER